jgi:hypothetical protein
LFFPSLFASRFLQLNLPSNAVIFVDDEVTLADCERALRSVTAGPAPAPDEMPPLAGVDAEWKPSLGSSQNNVALLQIGLRDRVFVIDLMSLSQDSR